jgi:hypothetical protein
MSVESKAPAESHNGVNAAKFPGARPAAQPALPKTLSAQGEMDAARWRQQIAMHAKETDRGHVINATGSRAHIGDHSSRNFSTEDGDEVPIALSVATSRKAFWEKPWSNQYSHPNMKFEDCVQFDGERHFLQSLSSDSACTVILYQKSRSGVNNGDGGWCAAFNVDEGVSQREFSLSGNQNDQATSVQIFGERCRVRLYEHTFNGATGDFNKPGRYHIPDWMHGCKGGCNDKVTSLKIKRCACIEGQFIKGTSCTVDSAPHDDCAPCDACGSANTYSAAGECSGKTFTNTRQLKCLACPTRCPNGYRLQRDSCRGINSGCAKCESAHPDHTARSIWDHEPLSSGIPFQCNNGHFKAGTCDGTLIDENQAQRCTPCTDPNCDAASQYLGPQCDGDGWSNRQCQSLNVEPTSHRLWIGSPKFSECFTVTLEKYDALLQTYEHVPFGDVRPQKCLDTGLVTQVEQNDADDKLTWDNFPLQVTANQYEHAIALPGQQVKGTFKRIPRSNELGRQPEFRREITMKCGCTCTAELDKCSPMSNPKQAIEGDPIFLPSSLYHANV